VLKWLNSGLEQLGRVVTGILLSGYDGGLFGSGTRTTSGEDVTPDSAMTLSAVFLAVDLYASAHIVMPCGVYAKMGGRREYVDTNPAHKLIHLRPNPEMTAGVYWGLVEAHRLLWGVSFSEIEWNGRGEPKYIWPLEPWRVTVRRSSVTNRLVYDVSDNRGQRTLEDSDVLIFPHYTKDGITFKSAITYGAESIGGAQAAERTGNKWLGNGGMPQGFVKHPQRMDKTARDNFRKEWRDSQRADGVNVGILWEGMDWVQNQMDPESLQLLQTKQAKVIDVARWFKVQPNKLMELLKSSYSTNEQADLDWVKGSILPCIVKKEQEINSKLLRFPDYYCKFSVEGLLRGDSAARLNWYKGLREIGVYSVNDVLDYEDMDRIGPDGDVRVVNAAYIPLNMLESYWEAKAKSGNPADMPTDPNAAGNSGDNPGGNSSSNSPADNPTDPQANPKPKADRQKQGPPKAKRTLTEEPFFIAELGRIRRREDKALLKAAKSPAVFLTWLDEFVPKHEALMREVLTVPAIAADDLTERQANLQEMETIVANHCQTLRDGLLAAAEVPAADFAASIETFIKSRPEPVLNRS